MAFRYSRSTSEWHPHSRLVRTLTIVFALLASDKIAAASPDSQWALRYLKAEACWIMTRGAGVEVAVVDTGVQPNADLSVRLLPGADFSDTTGVDIGNGQVDTDTLGHGTGEASLIAGGGELGSGVLGLAPQAMILPIRATDGTSAGLVFGVAPGIEYAISHGSRVINLALAYDVGGSDIRRAIQDAIDHDVVVVAAVGNDGSAQQYYPVAWPGVVGVGAVDSSGRVWDRSNRGADVDLVAPGVHILRDDNRGRVGYSDGTSEATAYVSAAAALVRSAHPGWSAGEVVAALVGTADKPAEMRGAVRDDRYGAGILDVLAAVSLRRPPGDGSGGAGRVGGSPAGAGRGGWWWAVGGAGLAAGAGVLVYGIAKRRRLRRRA